MPFFLITGDITKVRTQAIVNAANNSLLGGGGVDGAIHRAAGSELLEECKKLGGCNTGDAKITSGYNLPAQYVIHTVGPIWRGGNHGEEELLSSCYRKSLEIAAQRRIESIAFPLISSGVYGYPKDEALLVAIKEIRSFLERHEMTVYMVIYNKNDYFSGNNVKHDLELYLRKNYADHSEVEQRRNSRSKFLSEECVYESSAPHEQPAKAIPEMASGTLKCYSPARTADGNSGNVSLNHMIDNMDMSFSEMLLKMIDERGMTDSECYRAANVDRRLFSKIRSDTGYHPRKQTCVAFAIALRLTLSGTEALLRSAGYALSHSSKFDVIIEYFLEQGIYDIYEINNTLYDYDQPLLGG